MQGNDHTVSVVIPHRDRRRLLTRCLDALRDQTYRRIECVVVDNDSSDGSLNWLSSLQPDLIVVPGDAAWGFGQSVNAGLAVARGEFTLIMNNDVLMSRRCIEQLVHALLADPQAYAATGTVISWRTGDIDSTGLRRGSDWHPQDRDHDRPRSTKPLRVRPVAGPPGALGLFRRVTLHELAEHDRVFDEGFQWFFEDLDLAIRAQARGWRTAEAPLAVAYHWRGGTLQIERGRDDFSRLPSQHQQTYWRSRYRLLAKHRQRRRWWMWPVLLGSDLGRLTWQLLGSPWRAWGVLKALIRLRLGNPHA